MPESSDDLPDWLATGLGSEDDDTLRAAIEYAEKLLVEREEAAEEEEDEPEETVAERDVPEEWEGTEQEWRESVDDSDAPSRATLTTKIIKGNPYLYWQWSENDRTKSEYIAPANPKR